VPKGFRNELDGTKSEQYPIEGFCEHGDEHSGSITRENSFTGKMTQVSTAQGKGPSMELVIYTSSWHLLFCYAYAPGY
jgi:hypothetical protein